MNQEEKNKLLEGTPYEGWPAKKLGEPFFPNHVAHQSMQMLIVVGVLIALATLLPAPMEPKADPFSTPEHIKPEWYFLASYQFLKIAEKTGVIGAWAPKLLGVMAQGIALLLIIFIPFLDKGPERHPARRKAVLAGGILFFLAFLALTVWGHYS